MIGHDNITYNSDFYFIQIIEPLINSIVSIGNAKKGSPFMTGECDKVNTIRQKAMLEPDWHL